MRVVANCNCHTGLVQLCIQDTFAHATHSAGRPSAARDDRVSCIQGPAPRAQLVVHRLRGPENVALLFGQ